MRRKCRQTLDQVRSELLQARNGSEHWTGQLSSSALSTATAVSAMSAVLLRSESAEVAGAGETAGSLRPLIGRGMEYLSRQQNADGGFGDTDRSHSNIATSYLVLAASTLAGKIGEATLDASAVADLERYLDRAGRLSGLRARYGKDKTFVVPIMNNLAIAGLISWDQVAALPFEAAVFPQSMYRFLQMPVVSYAIPALVAIGQARHFLGRRVFFPLRLLRSLSVNRTLGVLETMQPASGGYLEATPLTAFVVMSLAATGRCDLAVVRNGLRFLTASVLADGSWPIDTNLATWATSLSIHALACDPSDDGDWYSNALAEWHLGCQHLARHPFTGAEPGGWGWTDLSGAVPDSDDTPAAILALDIMRRYADGPMRRRMDRAARQGVDWLLRLQNRNGGWPTFCRGWGKLPFDRSSTDLTAHAMRAMRLGSVSPTRPMSAVLVRSLQKGQHFLTGRQGDDGSWMPLWFGNQDRDDESNPIYGTSKVLIAGGTGERSERLAQAFLLDCQNPDGGWGGGASVAPTIRRLADSDPFFSQSKPQIPDSLQSSVEETALAVDALATVILRDRDRISAFCSQFGAESPGHRSDQAADGLTEEWPGGSVGEIVTVNDGLPAAILRGVDFLTQSVQDRRHQVAWPIGFYFAKLWYHERLYPLIFTAAALGKVLRATDEKHDPDWPR
jgi:squalene-hopene/tetraprenyl-beta-curcumene cyclase